MAALTVGRGTQDGVDVGPLIDEAAQQKVADLVADAVDRGATVLTGGGEHDGAGYFYAPTVLTGVPRGCAHGGRGDLRSGRPAHARSPPRRRSWPRPTTPSTASSPTCSPTTCAVRSAWREAIETGMVGLNQGVVSNPAAPSAGSRSPASAARADVGIDEFLEIKYIGIATG